MKDAGFRRYLSFSLDFDARANTLLIDPTGLNEEGRAILAANQERTRRGLVHEFGTAHSDDKIKNFMDLGIKPMSIIAYHNLLFHQARSAFVIGSYFPALTSACALGERLLNHMVLDLRSKFSNSSCYQKIKDQKAFSNWKLMIDVLTEWNVLLDDVRSNFISLSQLRNKSLHFNNNMSSGSLREDALLSLDLLRSIISRQFGSFGNQPWMISGTLGHCFIKKEYEQDPFIIQYYIPQCPRVGVFFAIRFTDTMQPEFFDHSDYGYGAFDDEEFKKAYNERTPAKVVNPDDPTQTFQRQAL